MYRLICLCIAAFVINFYATAQSGLAPIPKCRRDFVVIAHRGDHVKAPENTLTAFNNAILHGADFVEIDLRTTKDSVLVIMHDATVDRMTNGTGKVNEQDYQTISQLKIYNKQDSETVEYYPIPRFEEVLEICRNKIFIYLDFKDADVLQTYRLIQQYGMTDQVIVYINSKQQFEQWRKIVPSMPLIISLPDNIRSAETLATFLKENKVEILDGNYNEYTPEMVKLASTFGVKVWPDIQSSTEFGNWEKAIRKGFTGLQTDHPEALILFLEKMGVRF